MKPLLLLDIDGVLCPFGNTAGRYLRPITGHEYAQIDPKHTAWLHELNDLFRLSWASFWESGGNEVLGPAHGLEPIPFVPFENVINPYDQTPKLYAIKQYVGDEPFAWVDDDLNSDAFAWARERSDESPTLLIQTDPERGLDEYAMSELRLFSYNLRNQ